MKTQLFLPPGRVSVLILALLGFLALPFSAAAATCSSSNLPTGPTAYVATSPNLVSVVDASANTVACTIAVGNGPTNLAVSPDGSQLFVENDTDASISVVDLSTGSVTNTISLTTSGITAPMTANLAVSPDGTFVYVANLPQTLTSTTQANLNVISLPSLSVSAAISLVASPATPVTGPGLGISFLPDASKAYIATEGLTYIVTGGASPTVSSTTIPVNGGTAAVRPAGDIAYVVDVASAANTVSQITTATNVFANLNPTPSCSQANTTAITPDGTLAYYTCPGNNFVQAIATGTNSVSATVNLASTPGPQGIAITSDGASAYVANNDGSISVITISGNTVATPISGAGAFRGIGFRPVQLSIAPTMQSVPTGTTFQFTSTLKYAFGGVTWSVSCTAGGAACGMIDNTGKYTAPNAIPAPNDVKVTVTSSEIPVKSLKYPGQSVSAPVTVTPSQLVFTTQPVSGTVAGTPLPAVVVSVEDAAGNVDTTSTVSITISSNSTPTGAAALTGNLTVSAVAGVATFNNLVLTQANIPPASGSTTVTPYSYTLTATSVSAPPPVLTPATSNAFTIAPATPTKLVFTTQPPANGTAGSALAPPVIVTVEDNFNNAVTNSGASINMSSTPTNVDGTTTNVATVNGVATFSNLVFTLPGSYTLTATNVPLSLTSLPSSSITITPGPPVKLVVTGSGTQTAGTSQALTITAKDSSGNTATSYAGDKSLTFSGANSSANPVTAPTVTDKTGTARSFGTATTVTFTNGVSSAGGSLTLFKAETAMVAATDGSISAAGSDRLTVVVSSAAASKLVITGSGTQTAGTSQNLTITAEDTWGNTASTYGGDKSLTFSGANSSSNPVTTPTVSDKTGTAQSFGTPTTVTFTNGVNTAGGSAKLYKAETAVAAATDGTISATASNRLTITVSAAAPNQLVFSQQPTTTTAGQAITPAVTVQVEDPFGNLETSDSSAVSITVSSGGAFAGNSTTSVSASGGIATFSNLLPTRSGPFTLTSADGSLTVATSNSFAVVGDPAALTPAGAPGSGAGNRLGITGSSANATINLLGPAPSDAVTFTISCAVTTDTTTVTPPGCGTSLTSTTGTNGGVTPITVTLSVIRGAGSPPAVRAIPSLNNPPAGLPGLRMLGLLLALILFAVVWTRFVQFSSGRALRGFAFVFLLCLSVGWMSACSQFPVPATPTTPIPPTATGTGMAVVTITPSGAGPGADAYSTQSVTIFFSVQ